MPKVQRGMEQVSSVLPFLLAGGFSQNEIISYLKAKQEAAKEVSTSLAADEEEKVGVTPVRQTAHMEQTMTTNAPSDTGVPEEESALSDQSLSGAPAQPSPIANEIFMNADLTIPKMVDIARYETRKVTNDKEEAQRQQKLHESLLKIADPAKFVTEAERQKFENLKLKLTEESKKGDKTAGMILSAATKTFDTNSAATLPNTNQTQAVSQQDYDAVEKMWEEYYRTLPVPAEYGSDRIAWITADSKYIDETIGLLQAKETQLQEEGQKRVADIMPMLLLGGFSSEEVIGYLKAKLTAGKTVLAELQKEEESSVTVAAQTGEKQKEEAEQVEENPEDK
jgi:hypothetical protein